ncbi:DUF4230 domain-containing protein [Leptolyngbya sp. FACHB-671]|uniref:DUF4230 domain-containing protein n=1 Tax=Leptolyngbya sp. FACHB-671 TaxID=2692812 RepID=UPI0016848B70|nr:DUF4230 domain-containing protein [Leptolyngbya sp. FACHB-671]MBD2070288.1 DUF4230 domain-containing protein [Leptolyngbya sp. FACHB-671]
MSVAIAFPQIPVLVLTLLFSPVTTAVRSHRNDFASQSGNTATGHSLMVGSIRDMFVQQIDTSKRSQWLVPTIILIILLLIGYIFFSLNANRTSAEKVPGLVVKQIQSVSELTTAIVTTETIVPINDNGGFLWTESKLLYVANGQVRLGIDLSDLKADDVVVEGDTVTVTLPAPQVLLSHLNVERSYVYSFDKGFLGWGPESIKLQADAERKATDRMRESGCTDWVINSANERLAKTVDQILSQILLDKGYKEVIIKTQKVSPQICTFSATASQYQGTADI